MSYSFPNFNGCTVEVWELISNFITNVLMDATTYPWFDKSYTMLVKESPVREIIIYAGRWEGIYHIVYVVSERRLMFELRWHIYNIYQIIIYTCWIVTLTLETYIIPGGKKRPKRKSKLYILHLSEPESKFRNAELNLFNVKLWNDVILLISLKYWWRNFDYMTNSL